MLCVGDAVERKELEGPWACGMKTSVWNRKHTRRQTNFTCTLWSVPEVNKQGAVMEGREGWGLQFRGSGGPLRGMLSSPRREDWGERVPREEEEDTNTTLPNTEHDTKISYTTRCPWSPFHVFKMPSKSLEQSSAHFGCSWHWANRHGTLRRAFLCWGDWYSIQRSTSTLLSWSRLLGNCDRRHTGKKTSHL